MVSTAAGRVRAANQVSGEGLYDAACIIFIEL